MGLARGVPGPWRDDDRAALRGEEAAEEGGGPARWLRLRGVTVYACVR